MEKVYWAGMDIPHGERQIVATVTGPQCSYWVELPGAAIVSHLAAMDDDDLAIDDQTVAKMATQNPHRECADMHLQQKAHKHFSHTPVHIPSHKQDQR